MGYLLQDRLEVSIFINDIEYPLGDTNLLNSLHITTTVRGSLPLLSMSITDVQRVMDRIGMQDGVPIRVVINPMGMATRTYNFRKFDHSSKQEGSSFTWIIVGYYDSPLYWNATTSVGIKGTSNIVLKTIADKCGLKFDGIGTNDSQLWLPKNRSYRAFAKAIAEGGYVNEQSCTRVGVDLDGTMRYKDVNNLPEATKNIIGYQYEKGSVTAVDVSSSATSGFNNAISGYQNMRYAQSTVADAAQTQLKDLVFSPDSRSPLYNTKLKALLQRGPVRFGPIDVGNVHQNYERATYQNTRYCNLFSMGLELLIPTLTDFKILEQINLSIQREDTSQDASKSGVYTVTGHSLFIKGANYFEKLGVTRHGTNEKYENR